jgi:hypothetical protein
MRFPTGLRALNHRDFRLFIAGQLISLIGTSVRRGSGLRAEWVELRSRHPVGIVAEWFGVSAAYAVGGGLGLLSVLVLTLVWARGKARARSASGE